jgi:hypothetical protein
VTWRDIRVRSGVSDMGDELSVGPDSADRAARSGTASSAAVPGTEPHRSSRATFPATRADTSGSGADRGGCAVRGARQSEVLLPALVLLSVPAGG